jgi:hypothetical protein
LAKKRAILFHLIRCKDSSPTPRHVACHRLPFPSPQALPFRAVQLEIELERIRAPFTRSMPYGVASV